MKDIKPVGSLWLQEHFELRNFSVTHRSYIGNNNKIELTASGKIDQIYGPKYAPTNNTPLAHLEFSLKYDDLNLAFLKAVFNTIKEIDIINYIALSPSGKYSRKTGFLYEFLTRRQLNIPVEISGNYINLLETSDYITGNVTKDTKWRINNNLLGNTYYCPIVRRTKILDELLQSNIKDQITQLKENYTSAVFKRAIHYLYTKETKSSYEIEHEKPSPERMERFISLLEKAGSENGNEILSEKKLTALQNVIVDPRFAAEGFRNFQNYIGQTLSDHTQKIHYICPPPQYLPSLMKGLKDCIDKTTDTVTVIKASIIAFGFVFIHPFEDGNGRLHRFLIHDTLVRDKVVPEGLIIPVSANMLKHLVEYDKALENYSKPLMQYIKYALQNDGGIAVTNPDEVESYFRYPDLTAQSIFLAQTILATIANDMPDELEFIQCYDELKKKLQDIVDMPDKDINNMIIFLHQNKGAFPKRRRNDFSKLTDEEIIQMERTYREIFYSNTNLNF